MAEVSGARRLARRQSTGAEFESMTDSTSKMQKKQSDIVCLSLSVCFALSFFVLIFTGISEINAKSRLATVQWSETEGILVAKPVAWPGRLRYTYHIDGKELKGSHYQLGNIETRPQSFLDSSNVGSKVTVLYDVKDPSTAILDRSFPDFSIVWYLAGLAGALAAVFIALARRGSFAACDTPQTNGSSNPISPDPDK